MFDFMRKPGARSPSAPIRRAIEADGLPLGVDRPSALAVVEQRGQYDGRAVTYIRIFEPAWARALGVDVTVFDDLDAHPSLVLKSGHIERDGAVMITARASESDDDAWRSTADDPAGREGEPSVALAPERS
jgi:hypothetical protein